MKVSVVIPTIGRVAFLRVALRSVAAQTARDRIGEIVLSDNGAASSAETVAAEFPDLPVRVVRHHPPLSASDHFHTLHGVSAHPLVAILHDDDWWAPAHLASALACLDARPDCVACYTAFAEVPAESSPATADNSLGVWFAAGCPGLDRPWNLDLGPVLLASLPGTFGRFSALVARSEALRRTAFVYRLGNPFDTDRMLGFALAELGPLGYSPLATCYIRRHPGQDGGRFDFESVITHMSGTTRWMLTRARDRGIDPAALLAAALAACPVEHRTDLARLHRQPWTRTVLADENIWPPVFEHALSPPRPGLTTRDFIPPAVLHAWRALRSRQRSAAKA